MGARRSSLPICGVELVYFRCSAWLDDGGSDAVEARDEDAGALIEESAHGGGKKSSLLRGVLENDVGKIIFVRLISRNNAQAKEEQENDNNIYPFRLACSQDSPSLIRHSPKALHTTRKPTSLL